MTASELPAPEAYREAGRHGGSDVIGWALDEDQRGELLDRFPPAYPDVVADHVTLASHTMRGTVLPKEREGRIVGESDDGAGVQALVVEIGGTSDRPDGSHYHLTWSLDRRMGRQGADSNAVIRDQGWRPVSPPVPIRLRPASFRPS